MARGGGPPGALRGRQPGTGKTYLARKIVTRLREQGEAVHLVSKTHCSAQNLGLTGCAGTSATGACKNLTGSWLRRSPSWTWRSGRTWRAWG